MLQFFSKYKPLLWTMLPLSAVILFIFYTLLKPVERLPVYQPTMVDRTLVDSTVQFVKKYHKIAPFTLINQNGDTITEAHYADKIYVADFFFTTCQSICPVMTDHMLDIQKELAADTLVKLLSHTVIPETDSVPQLKKYALDKGIDESKWDLVTGPKKEIYALARKSYLAAKSEGDGGPYDMIHTENFMLIDKEKRIRGFYDGTDAEAIATLLKDIAILKKEYQPEPSWWERWFG
ncbi:SCO family protein [Croceiramulus getboli]|nr:SCO family protein [Flavobacteriaceae bacterium YJPT1-3]